MAELPEPSMPYGSVCECGAPLNQDLECMAPNTLAHDAIEFRRAFKLFADALAESLPPLAPLVAWSKVRGRLAWLKRIKRWLGWLAVATMAASVGLRIWLGAGFPGSGLVSGAAVSLFLSWLVLDTYHDGFRDGVGLMVGRPLRRWPQVAIDDPTDGES